MEFAELQMEQRVTSAFVAGSVLRTVYKKAAFQKETFQDKRNKSCKNEKLMTATYRSVAVVNMKDLAFQIHLQLQYGYRYTGPCSINQC